MKKEKILEKHHKRFTKSVVLLASLVLLIGIVAGGTIAYMIASSGDPVVNEFTPSSVTTKVVETFDGTTKSNVRIQNTGNTDAWIRADIIVTWQNADGNVYGQKPVLGTDYTMNLKLASQSAAGWFDGSDGFYYWYMPVKPVTETTDDCTTGVLIESCAYLANAPEGYFLNVEILGSGIQSKPADVFDTEWASSGLEVNDSDANPSNWVLEKKTNVGGVGQ